MELEYYHSLEPFWGCWKINKLLGEGTYGKVFEIEREDFGNRYVSALKIMTIPPSESEWKSMRAEGMDDLSVTSYFRGITEELANEMVLMDRLKGNSNIVSYEDHDVIEHADGRGWDILIRMELLTPLTDICTDNIFMSRQDVLKMGVDLCNALIVCEKEKLVHRDIKPENIFISKQGDYKLGDFGVAKQMERADSTMSRKGTYTYMAPEVIMGKNYDHRVDIFSLGMVLYRQLNNNRAVFLPSYPAPVNYMDKENALNRRLSGESFPCPADADDNLMKVLQKACAFNPDERYMSASEFKNDLMACMEGKTPVLPQCVIKEVHENEFWDSTQGKIAKVISGYRFSFVVAFIMFVASIAVILMFRDSSGLVLLGSFMLIFSFFEFGVGVFKIMRDGVFTLAKKLDKKDRSKKNERK